MTIDEAIKYCEDVAEENDMQAEFETDYECYKMSDFEKSQCKKCASEHKQLAEWLKDYKRLKEQESSRDMEKIEEVINCDADAEIKLNMISNIVYSKPHYFKTSHENKIIDEHYWKGFNNGIRTAEWRATKQESCNDAVSRQAVKDLLVSNGIYGYGTLIDKLPPVNPQEKIGRCKECKYFDDNIAKADGCKRWDGGILRCKTKEDGYCFLFEPQIESEE